MFKSLLRYIVWIQDYYYSFWLDKIYQFKKKVRDNIVYYHIEAYDAQLRTNVTYYISEKTMKEVIKNTSHDPETVPEFVPDQTILRALYHYYTHVPKRGIFAIETGSLMLTYSQTSKFIMSFELLDNIPLNWIRDFIPSLPKGTTKITVMFDDFSVHEIELA